MRRLTPLTSNFRDFSLSIYYANDLPINPKILPIRIKKELISPYYFDIENRYLEYINNQNRLEETLPSCFTKDFNENLYNDLFSLYESKKVLKEKIRKISDIQCPYCGTNESPFHVDHFLPRSKFPEFSIYNQNLIGACASCNSRFKGDDFKKDGQRLFFNPYFDTFIEDKKFLKCSLSVETFYLIITFSIDETLGDEYEYNIIQNHFTELNLEERYKNLVLKDILKKFKDERINQYTREYKVITLEELKIKIAEKIDGFASFNDNHWEKVFWIALKECDDYLNLIVEKKYLLIKQ